MTDSEMIGVLNDLVDEDNYLDDDNKEELKDFLSLVEAHLEEIFEDEEDFDL